MEKTVRRRKTKELKCTKITLITSKVGFFSSLSQFCADAPQSEGTGTVSQTSNESTIQKLNTVHLPLTLLNTLSLNKVCGTIYYSRR